MVVIARVVGKHFNKHLFSFRDTLFISITNSLTSILAGFVIFSAFGYMSYLQGIPVSQLAVDGKITKKYS